MYILSIDFETGGLDPKYHPVLSVGAVLLDDDLNKVYEWESLVRPFKGCVMDPKALDVNELDPEICDKTGRSETEILDHIEWITKWYTRLEEEPTKMVKTVWAGQNPHFDFDFYRAMLDRAGRMVPATFDYHLLDTWTIGVHNSYHPTQGVEKTVKGCGLSKIGRMYDISFQAHRALADAIAAAEIIRKTFQGDWELISNRPTKENKSGEENQEEEDFYENQEEGEPIETEA